MASIFTRIIQGEIPCYKVAENDQFFAFLDINPVAKGHLLVVPKQETDYLFELDDQLLADLMVYAKKIALAMQKVIECERISVTVLGLEIPHAHVHLIPLDSSGMFSFGKKLQLPKEEMAQIAASISEALVS